MMRLSVHFIIVLVGALALTALSVVLIHLIYANWANTSGVGTKEFRGTLPYIYVGFFGVVATVITILLSIHAIIRSATISRENQRMQDTTKILFESRFSTQYQSWIKDSKVHFPPREKGSVEKYFSPSAEKNGLCVSEKDSAEAAAQILNYYEFMATGIYLNTLDEEMLRKTIRGMVCRLVFEMRDIIRHYRVEIGREKSYEHLVALYWEWVDKEDKNKSEWEEGVDLGPMPDLKIPRKDDS